ncbi:hypothetical protein RFI_13711 [Reticulomyxa filosa]|uniref:G-protein beta WD-40 repeats containing protein n=1 Tax=Reticulomyxa filosa TaxID=46433 RepID=X6NC54_RETFI|nr:hypothetical protein RFI_13711 [Reticulomyxa filosa]|eukprot:ETO23473.1 hypothetical protein RFI_13711 [Reticulomyxa filosa]
MQYLLLYIVFTSDVFCVKFSPYHYHNHRQNVIYSSSHDKTIRFWDFKHNQRLQILDKHAGWVDSIEFSSFNGGNICVLDLMIIQFFYGMLNHTKRCIRVDFSPFQSNNCNDKCNRICVIDGNGYTICSVSFDKTVRIWDIETAKPLTVFRGHEGVIRSVKYGSNELRNIDDANILLSGADDKSVRLWDTRSGQQIQVLNGHYGGVRVAEYTPFVVSDIEVGGNSNVICSGSNDDRIASWDIRSNKKVLHVISGILCLKFLQLKKDRKSNIVVTVILICVMIQDMVKFVFGDSKFFQK